MKEKFIRDGKKADDVEEIYNSNELKELED